MTLTSSLTPHASAAPAPTSSLLRGATVLTVLAMAGFGFLYSLAGVGIGQALFPQQAAGSLVVERGSVVGSALVAQPFTGERWFQPRPSAASYNPMAMGGSNQARTHPDLRKRLQEQRAAVAQRDGVAPQEVAPELFTQSGSGIDPHISPQGAAQQVARVARARGLAPARVQALVVQHTDGPQFGLFGPPRVNVLRLNLALQAQR